MDGESKGKSEKELRAKVRSVPGSQGVKILKGSLSLSLLLAFLRGRREGESEQWRATVKDNIISENTTRRTEINNLSLVFSFCNGIFPLSLSLSCSLAERVYTILTRDSSKLYSASTMTMMMMMLFS